VHVCARPCSYDEVITLRAGAALAGIQAEQLWLDCLSVGGGEYVTFDRVLEAFACLEQMNTNIWNMAAMAINNRLLSQGIPPLFHPRPAEVHE
jgi:hypothetical protein